jgi:hypothetical protein
VIGIFKQKAAGNVALLLIAGLVLKLPLFIYPKIISSAGADGKLYALVVLWIKNSNIAVLSGLLSFLLLYVQSLIINGIVNEYRMTTRQTFLPGLSYMLITSLMPEWSFLSAPLVATTLILLALAKLFHLYNNPLANSKIYNIGLLLGIASFFYFPSFLFSVCFITGLLILRPFRLNEVLLLVLGITTPYYFYAVYLFLTDNFSWQQLLRALWINVPGIKASLRAVGSIILIIVPFLVGAYYIQINLRKMLIQARKNWSIILLCLLFALLIGFTNGAGVFTNWVIAVAPFAAFHACAYYYPPKKWVSSVLFFATITFILVQQYLTVAWQQG